MEEEAMKYGSRNNICATCQFWNGERKNEPFTVEVKENIARCAEDFAYRPSKAAQSPACAKYKKWDKIK